MTSLRIVLALSLVAAAACGDDDDNGGDDDVQPTVDAAVSIDAPDNTPDAANDTPDAGATPDTGPLTTSEQIAMARAAADGAVDIAIDNALVTYIKPAVGSDPTGFFLQADQTGPALFVAVDPAAVAAGDDVSLRVTEMGTAGGVRQATAVADVVVNSNGNELSGLVQDVSAAADLVTAINNYDSELVTVTGTLVGDFGFAGGGHQSAQMDTAGVTGNTDLKLRLPEPLVDTLDLASGCVLTVGPTPMWRFNAQAQPSAWVAGDVSVTSCNAPKVVSAVATSSTEVRVTFDRLIASASVTGDGSQFTFDNGLTASAAAVDGRDVTVTTTAQVVGTTYTVTVATTVTDTLSTALDDTATTATFDGFEAPAVLAINEINANISNGCDLVELRVISGGQLAGIRVLQRRDDLYTFPSMIVATNDIIVLHLDQNDATNCNASGAVDETATVTDQAAATHPQNFDAAFDVWSTTNGLIATTNVVQVVSAADEIQDAVLLTNDAGTNPAGSTEDAAGDVATAGEWEMVGGGVPAGGFAGTNYSPHAVLDLNGTGTDNTGDTIQRNTDTDSNTTADWTQTTQSWGTLNAGQSAL